MVEVKAHDEAKDYSLNGIVVQAMRGVSLKFSNGYYLVINICIKPQFLRGENLSFQERCMIYSNISFTEKTTTIKTALDKADAIIIIGAGSGLSRTCFAGETGLRYDDADCFNATFPGSMTAMAYK